MSFKLKFYLGWMAVILIIPIVGNAQPGFRKGEKYFNEFSYAEAIYYYKRTVKADSTNTLAWERLGDCYRLTNSIKGATAAYRKAISLPNTRALTFLYLAQSLLINNETAAALEVAQQYRNLAAQDQRGLKLIKAITDRNLLLADTTSYKVQKININSTQCDFYATPFENGIVYSSNRQYDKLASRLHTWTGRDFYRLYFAEGKEATFNQPKLFLPQYKIKFHNGPACFSVDGKEMYFTRNNVEDGKVRMSDTKIIKLKIFVSRKNDNWEKEIPFEYNSDQYSVCHPSISADGNTLYFSSDMPGTLGGMDIFYVTKKEGKWSQPINMGESVNTLGNEVFPSTDLAGNLYFSSDGQMGLGGLDVFKAISSNGNITSISNVGAPINSSDDDFAFLPIADGSKGYFTSNRIAEGENDDIYFFTKECNSLYIVVKDAQNMQLLPGTKVSISENGIKNDERVVDSSGGFTLCTKAGVNYEFTAEKENYLSSTIGVPASETSNQKTVSLLLKTKPAIFFDLRGYVYSEEDKKAMEGVSITLLNTTNNTKQELITKADGRYAFESLDKESNYKILAAAKDCGTNSGQIATVGLTTSQSFVLDFGLFCKGDVIKIENIYYDLNKFNIRPDAAKELDKLLVILNKYPTMVIEMGSHTDCRASKSYNENLSASRAKSAMEYLVKKGIAASRLTSKGYGESQLLNECACEGTVKSTCSEEAHQLNRRTEFKIISF